MVRGCERFAESLSGSAFEKGNDDHEHNANRLRFTHHKRD